MVTSGIKGRCDGQHHVGELSGRVDEEVGMGVEVQRREGLPPESAVGMCQQDVRADQAPDGVWLPSRIARYRSRVVTSARR